MGAILWVVLIAIATMAIAFLVIVLWVWLTLKWLEYWDPLDIPEEYDPDWWKKFRERIKS